MLCIYIYIIYIYNIYIIYIIDFLLYYYIIDPGSYLENKDNITKKVNQHNKKVIFKGKGALYFG